MSSALLLGWPLSAAAQTADRRQQDREFDLHSDKADGAIGIWSNGTTMWEADRSGHGLYAGAPVGVTRADRGGHRGHRPDHATAPARVHRGYAFVKSASDLPLTVLQAGDVPPQAPTGFAASNGNEQMTLTWDAPEEDADIARHEYRFKTTGDYPAAWTAIDESAPGGLHEDWVVVTGLTNDVAYTFQLRAVNAGGDASAAAEAGPATPRSGVCGRTQQVRDEIVAIAGVSDCADVTTAQLAGVTILSLYNAGIKSLQPDDFSDLTALETLELDGNELGSLPDNVFSGLTALNTLYLNGNELTSLPAGVFSGLTALQALQLDGNELGSLPAGVFSGLTALDELRLDYNGLGSLPAGVFSGLTALDELRLDYNGLSSLPAGVFSGLTALETLYLDGNAVDPLPLAVTLEKNPDAAEIRAVVLTAAPFAVPLSVSVENGSLAGDVSTIEVPIGARESAWVGVTRTDGTTGAVTADIDLTTQPNLPGAHSGYAFVKSASDLPLRVLEGAPGAPAAPSVSAASSSSLTVTWSAPDDGGSAITDYDVRYRAGASGDWTDGSHDGTATTATLTGLGSGTTYEVQVRAANDGGAGPWSDSGSGATDGQAVPAPTGFAASNGNEQVTLTWDAPAEDADIARHEYRFKTTGDYPAAWTAIDESAPGGLHEDWVVVTGLANDVAYTFQLHAVNGDGDASAAAQAGPATAKSGVCGRTQQVRDEIVNETGVSDCADVTTVQLAGVTSLSLYNAGIKSLQPDDFSDLTALETLELDGNELGSLPDNVFSGLTALNTLYLNGNELTSLPAGVFSGLTALQALQLQENELGSLPAGVFSGLIALDRLQLDNNELSSLPAGVFSGLAALRTLDLDGNDLSSLPAGVFSGLTRLRTLGLGGNAVNPLPLAVTLELNPDAAEIRAVVPTAAPFAVPLRVSVENGGLARGAATISVPAGARESAWVGVTRTDGTTGAVTADIDLTTQPNLPGAHSGYAFVKSASDLPLRVLEGAPGAPAAPSVSAASSSSLTVTWSAPDDGGSAITDYDVRYRAGASGDWTDGSHDGTATTATLTGLGSGTTYEVQVRAANDGGAGPWSDSGSGATDGQAVPAPTGFAASNGNEQVTLTWDAPEEDADIARHEYRFKTTGDYPAAWTAIDESAPGGLHEDWVVVTGLANDVAYTFQLHAVNGDGDASAAALAGPATAKSGVCGRTQQVRDEIVNETGVSDCADVTTVQLAGVTSLYFYDAGIKSLQPDDFSDLTALETLELDGNELGSLPDNVFSGLTVLNTLYLNGNELTSLPAGVFSGLTALQALQLHENELTSLPAGVFSGLTALQVLQLQENELGSLPAGVFSGLTALDELRLDYNGLSSLPAGVFSGLTALETLYLDGNAVDPLPLAVTLEKNPDAAEIRAVVLTAAPFAVPLSVSVENGSLAGDVSTIEVPIGARESAWVGVTRTDGTTGAVTADIDLTTQPNLPGAHSGYAFVKSASDLPLRVLEGAPGAPAAPSVSAASSSSLTVTWSAPDDGGSAITDYDVRYRAGASGDWTDGSHDGTATTATLTGLGSGTTYEVQVRAANDGGAGPWSDSGSGATDGQAVPAPTGFAASNGNEQVTLTWDAPAEDADIARHEYRFKTTGDYPAAWTAIDESAPGGLHEDWVVVTGLANDVAYTFQLHAVNGDGDASAAALAGPATAKSGVCGRTQQVRDEIVNETGVSDCADVTTVQLAGVTSLYFYDAGIKSLQPDDFSDLTALETLELDGNELGSLPDNVFSGLTVLNTLYLNGNELTSLPAGVFSGLTALQALQLHENELTSLPAGVFSGLTALQVLQLQENELGSLPAGVFSGLTALEALQLQENELSSLPDNVFSGLANLLELRLHNNAVDPLPLAVTLERNPDAVEIRAVVLTAAPFAVPLRVSVENGSLAGDVSTITVPIGARESAWVGVTRTAGTTGAVTADIDLTTQPSLPSFDTGYAFVRSTNDLPLMVLRANAAPAFSSSATFDAAENQTAAGTVVAADSDSDDDITGYAITGGADQTFFSIGATSGALTFDAAPNFEDAKDSDTDNDYVVEVQATSGAGEREQTATQTITVTVTDVAGEAPGKPDAPTVSAASVTSLTVSWSAPANAGPAITDYDVDYRIGGSWSDWDHTGTATTATLTGLSENTSYQVQVRATNDEGTGSWSDSGTGTTDADANAAPTFSSSSTFDAAENQTAAGTVLATDGDTDDDVTGYEITGGADQSFFSIGATSGALTFDDAPNFEDAQDQGTDNTYVVEVEATSGTGTREKTATQTIRVTVTDVAGEAPGKPAAPSVSPASATSLTVSWSAPDNGGPAIDDYDVQYRAGTTGDWSDGNHTGTATTATLTGLSENTSYQVQVRATNDEGTGSWSDSGTGTTDADANAAPTFSSSSTFDAAENQTAAGTVLATDGDTDDDVTGYEITGGADQSFFSIGATSGALTFDDAPNFEDAQDQGTDNTYVVEVEATSGTGTREKTATQTITVTVTDVAGEAPGKPDAPTVSPASATSLTVSWSSPANAGPAIDDYDVQYREGTSGSWSDGNHTGTATTATLTGLSENTSYQVQVRATNDEGTGSWSDSGTGTTDADANAAPTFSSSSTFDAAENQTAAGTVLATDGDTDDDVTGYEITGGADQSFFSIGATSGALTFDDAPNFEDAQDQGTDNTYVVEVEATSGTGTREKTATQTIRVTVTDVAGEAPGRPDAPDVAAASVSGLTVSWSSPANAGPAIDDYDVQYREGTGGSWSDGNHTGTAVTATLTDLAESTSYQVQVRATNDEGVGSWSPSGTGTTDANAAPTFSSSSTFDAAENQTAAGTVLATDGDTDDDVTGYEITGGADQSFFSIGATSGALTFDDAPNFEDAQDRGTDNTYVVEVEATSGTGTREKTATQTITVTVTDVAGEAPGKPDAPTVSPASATSLTVSWSSPANAGPAIDDYDVQYREGTSGSWSDGNHTGTATTATLTDLAESTSYQVQVRATNDEGVGSWSPSGTGTTSSEGICDRTPRVRDRILVLLKNRYSYKGDCSGVTGEHLAKLKSLDLGRNPSTENEFTMRLKEDDFEGLVNLERLYMRDTGLRSLPAGVFDGLAKLEELELNKNKLESLPAGVFSDLESLQMLKLRNNPSLESLPYDELEALPELTELSVDLAGRRKLQVAGGEDDAALEVPEGGSATYELRLMATTNAKAANPVKVTVSSSDESVVTASPATVSFTRENWFRRQTVTVSAEETDSETTAELTHAADGAYYAYDKLPLPGVTVTVLEAEEYRAPGEEDEEDPFTRPCSALAGGDGLTPAAAAAALWEDGEMSDDRLAALDSLGNGNGRYDLGDLLAWLARCRRGEGPGPASGSTAPPAPPPALPASRTEGGASRRRKGARGPARRRRKAPAPPAAGSRTRWSGWLRTALLAALISASGCGDGIVGPRADAPRYDGAIAAFTDPGPLHVRLTAPAGARDIGAMLVVVGPAIDSVQAPGLEIFETDESSATRREVIIAGALPPDAAVLRVWVPHRGDQARYRVRLLQVAGDDFSLRDLTAYGTEISR